MVFFFRKFIEALLLPIGFSGLLVIAGIALRRRWISFLGVVVLYACATPYVGGSFLKPLERTYPPISISQAPVVDAIVVLSGSNVRGVNPAGLQWGETSNRYFTGLDLAAAGKARLLVFSNAETWDPNSPNQGLLLQQHAVNHGIRPDRIVITKHVLTTEDEAREVAQIPGVHSILLVTSAFHLPRAVLLFQRHGLQVTPFPTDQRGWGGVEEDGVSFIPRADGLAHAELGLREYYGLAVYRLIYLFRGSAK